MSTQLQEPPSQEEMKGFLEKLADFHKSLSPTHQMILDDMTAKAMVGPDDSEVEGFVFGETSLASQTPMGEAFSKQSMPAYYRPTQYYYYYYRRQSAALRARRREERP